ncbi:MAG: hypothetical protein IH984_01550 [Planctomycetes bacterium]|nr:hypothetical protein [Planctomycetota bacterium]
MTKFHNIINKAKRRMAAARAVYITGRALVTAILIAIVVLAVDRLMNLNLPTVTYIAIGSAGVLIGVITALLSKINTLTVAVRLDRRLNLRDRLGTAQAIRSGEISDTEFGQLITRDAERVAQRIDVKAATPIRFSNDWSVAGLLVIALGAAIAFVPSLDRSSKGQTPQEIAEHKEQLQLQQQNIAETIEDAVADVDVELLDEKVREDLEALKRLAQQLSDDAQSENDLADARNRSAAELGAIAKRLEEQSERNSQAVDSIAERFAGMEKTQAPMKSQEFEKALRDGEFEDAAEILDELKRQAEQMSEAERDAVAEHFRNMSEQLSEDDESTTADEEIDPVGDAMRDLGMDEETIDAILDEEKTEDEIADELKEQGIDEDIARELAEDVKNSQEQEEIDQQVDEQTKDLADALNDAADDIDQEEPQEEPQEKPQQGSSPKDSSDSEADSTADAASGDESQDEQDTQTQEGTEKRQVENDESTKQTDSKQEQQVARQQDQEEGQRQEEQIAKPGKEQIEQQKPGQQTFDPADPNAPKQEEASQEEDKQQPQNDQSNKKQSVGKEDPNAKRKLPKDLGKALRELAKKAQDAAKGKKASERLREAARKLADSLSDEEKRELAEKWMGKFNKPPDDKTPLPSGGEDSQNTHGSAADRIVQNTKDNLEPDIEDVDVTGDNPGAKSIFEWLSDQPIEGDPKRTTQSKQVVRKARSAAEHAVGESTVPKRYHDLIQRYFGKLNDTVEKAEKQSGKTDSTTNKTPTKTTTEDDS